MIGVVALLPPSGRAASDIGMFHVRHQNLGQERALRAGEDSGRAGHLKGPLGLAVVGVEADEDVHPRRFDGEVSIQVRVAQFGGGDLEGYVPGISGRDGEACEAGQLLGGSGSPLWC